MSSVKISDNIFDLECRLCHESDEDCLLCLEGEFEDILVCLECLGSIAGQAKGVLDEYVDSDV